MRDFIRLTASLLFIATLLVSCTASPQVIPTATQAAVTQSSPSTQAPPTATPSQGSGVWVGEAVPAALRAAVESSGFAAAADPASAGVIVDQSGDAGSTWVYALVAPFPTIQDGVSAFELRSAWTGTPSETFEGRPLLMEDSTLAAFTTLWGAPAAGAVQIVDAAELADPSWSQLPSWGIVPFESLNTRWKVLDVDGQSPVRKDFDRSAYPLVAQFSAQGTQSSELSLPATNRDPEKLTTIIMTGVTALVRATAKTMEIKGVLYPGRDIRNWLREADIAHISNEIPFFTGCGYPSAAPMPLVFCSSPRYIDLLTDLGTDVIELTGNHFFDYGTAAMLETLKMYNDLGIPYYGGGADLEDALKGRTLENHGNKIAFIGCNKPDIGAGPTATAGRPGAAPCDFDVLAAEVTDLKSQGYLVIFTFQWNERESFDPVPYFQQEKDFRLVADAGADIVSGSQAHFPMTMEFYGDSFIHYGLGNLFFDQMGECCAGLYNRKEFLDRYVVYDNRLISIELLTAMLEDYARPRPMTPEERTVFLHEYFVFSGWLPEEPAPVIGPTLTLTPITLPSQPAGSSPTPTVTP